MKKHLILLLCLTLALFGCADASSSKPVPAPTVAEPGGDTRHALITVHCGGKSIEPYMHFYYSEAWMDVGFLAADGTPIQWELSTLTEEGALPALDYAEDFSVTYAEDVSFSHILLFDEESTQLDSLYAVSDLSKLDPGLYYVGIAIDVRGRYIAEANTYEGYGWVCAFRLRVEKEAPDTPETLAPFDSGRMDIDGDGVIEDYTISYGPTSGLFTYQIRANVDGEPKYSNLYNSVAYRTIRFERATDGSVRLLTVDQAGGTKAFAVSIENGNIVLTGEDGVVEEYWGPQGVDNG